MSREMRRFSAWYAMVQIAALAWLGSAEAAPPAGTPVFIQVQGLAPASIGLNGFIVGGDFTEGGAFHWMPTSGVTLIGGESGNVSRDGRTTVGRVADANGNDQPAIWSGGTSWRLLGPLVPNALPCQGVLGSANAVSGDGHFLVGGGYYGTSVTNACASGSFSAFRWDESSGYVLLGEPGRASRADAISADGRVIVGYQQGTLTGAEGVKWVDGKQETIIGPLGVPVGYARAVNRDGTLIAGTACIPDVTPGNGPTAWAWTSAGGVKCYPVVDIPLWVPWSDLRHKGYNTYIYAVSDDGRIMGGDIQFDLGYGETESVVWFDGEPVFLRDYLRSHGYPDAFEGHNNTGRISAVSPDGRVIVGYNGGLLGSVNLNGFIVILPELDKK
jgi:uncharacterized membrane protein